MSDEVKTTLVAGDKISLALNESVTDVIVDGGSIYSAGGTVSNADLLSGEITMTNVSTLDDSSEGYGITVDGGKLIVATAKMYDTVFNLGSVTLYGNARFFDTTINGMEVGMWNASQAFVRTTVNAGKFTVSDGLADTVTLTDGVVSISGGTASDITVNTESTNALLEIRGGTVKNLILTEGTTNSVKLFNGARVYGGMVASGYTLGLWQSNQQDVLLDGMEIASGGAVTVWGGTVANTTVRGTLTVSSNNTTYGEAYNTVLDGGSLVVAQKMYNTELKSGSLQVYNGAEFHGVTIGSGMSLTLNADKNQAADNVTVYGSFDITGINVENLTVDGASAAAHIRSGASVSNLKLLNGSQSVKMYSGSKASGVTVENGSSLNLTGTQDVYVEDLEVKSGGNATVKGGTVAGASIAGKLSVSFADNTRGIVSDVTVNGGSIHCAGGTVSGVALLSGEMTMTNVQNEDYTEGYGIRVAGGKLIAAKAKMYNTVFESGSVALYGNARFFDTVINGMAIGMWYVGQQFVNTTVNSGSFTVGLGTADGITLNDGLVNVAGASGVAENVEINGGELTVNAGSADQITLNDGSIKIANGTSAKNITANGGAILSTGGYVSNVSLLAGEMTMTNVNSLDNGSEGHNITVAGGNLIVATAKMYDTVFNSGNITLYGNARFFDTTIDGVKIVMWDGSQSFTRTTVNSGTFIIGGGTADGITLNGGTVSVADASGVAKQIIINGGSFSVSAGSAENITLKSGSMTVTSIAGQVEANGGNLTIGGNAQVQDITVNDGGWVETAATAPITGVVLNNGGTIVSYDGAALENITVNGGKFSQQGATTLSGTLNWDITDGIAGYLSHWERCNTENLSEIALTVSANQQSGVYKLAEAAIVDSPASSIDDISITVKGLSQNYTLKAGESFTDTVSGYTGKLLVSVNEENDKVLTYVTAKGLVTEDRASFSGSDDNLMIGGKVSGLFFASKDVQENITTTITGGEIVKGMVGGVYAKGRYVNDTTAVTVNIAGGKISGPVYAGGYIYGNKAASDDVQMSVKTVALNLAGGEISGEIYGGIHARDYGKAEIAESVTINVTGGEYGTIFGGGWAQTGAESYVNEANITVSGGSVDTIYAGGDNAATHSGNAHARSPVGKTEITVKENGSVGTIYLSSKYITSAMPGSVTLTISGGSVNQVIGSAYGVDTTEQTTVIAAANISGTSLSNIDLLKINEGFTFDGSFADIDRVEFALDGELDADWTVLSAENFASLSDTIFNFKGVDYSFDQLTTAGVADVSFNENNSKYELKLLA